MHAFARDHSANIARGSRASLALQADGKTPAILVAPVATCCHTADREDDTRRLGPPRLDRAGPPARGGRCAARPRLRMDRCLRPGQLAPPPRRSLRGRRLRRLGRRRGPRDRRSVAGRQSPPAAARDRCADQARALGGRGAPGRRLHRRRPVRGRGRAPGRAPGRGGPRGRRRRDDRGAEPGRRAPRLLWRDHRRRAGDAAALRHAGPGRPLGLDGPDPGRERHRQGARGAGDPPGLTARDPALRRHQLLGLQRQPARLGAVRPQARRLHRRGVRQARPVRGRRHRHVLPRRDRRHVADLAGQGPARVAGGHVQPGRRHRDAQGRRPDHRRHQPRSPGHGRGRPVPRGPLLPHPRHQPDPAGAARARRGHPGPGRLLPRQAAPRPPRQGADARLSGTDDGLSVAGQRARARERDRAPGGAVGRRHDDRRGAPVLAHPPPSRRAQRRGAPRPRLAARRRRGSRAPHDRRVPAPPPRQQDPRLGRAQGVAPEPDPPGPEVRPRLSRASCGRSPRSPLRVSLASGEVVGA
jgi:hypothetical protein